MLNKYNLVALLIISCSQAYADENQWEYVADIPLSSMMKSNQFINISSTDALSLSNGRITLIIYAGSSGKFYRCIDYFDSLLNAVEHVCYKLKK